VYYPRQSRFLGVLLSIGSLCVTGAIEAGELGGKVTIRPVQSTPNPADEVQPGSSLFETLRPTNPLEEVVIWVMGASQGHGRHLEPSISQKQKSFEPRVLPIKVGTTVKFPNKDTFYHNVFSRSKLKPFNLGRYPKGEFRSITFDATGVIQVYCDIHSHMKAYVVVCPSDAFTVPEADGRYQISDIPAGTYQVNAWHPSFDLQSFDRQVREVKVTSGSTEVNFEF
jgi:plastocyanin